MNNNELYHYGVPGMKWGQRRAAKQLAKLTGRDRSKITAKEADKFRGDVDQAKAIKTAVGRESWAKLNQKALGGKKYADAVLKQASKEKRAKNAGKTAAALGTVGVGTVAVAAALPAIAFVGIGSRLAKEYIWDKM